MTRLQQFVASLYACVGLSMLVTMTVSIGTGAPVPLWAQVVWSFSIGIGVSAYFARVDRRAQRDPRRQ